MRYFYEYKIKNGAKVGGHNLEDMVIYNDKIALIGIDIINTYDGEEYKHWRTLLNPKEIEYITIIPIKEENYE